jgi:thiamine biosynthesis lipoprotein
MGTYYTVQYISLDSGGTELPREVDALLKEFDQQLSNWDPNSWVNKFNRLPAHISLPAPEHAWAVLALSLELAELSAGALDPTVSPLVELWGFGVNRSQEIPSDASIKETRRAVNFRHISIDQENHSVSKTNERIQLNCSAVAKGYAVDLIAALLLQRGLEDFLVNIGGEISARGRPSNDRSWTVAITALKDRAISTTVEIHDRALATSGHTQRVFKADGRLYSHIIDPRSGYPVVPTIRSASVLSPICALADGLATLALILDESEMKSVLKRYPGSELLITPWENEPN